MKIVNVVASGSLNTKIKLKELDEILGKSFEFDPEKYHCGYLKLGNRKISIFESGKYIMIGLKDLEELDFLYKKMKEMLPNNINLSEAKQPSISNIVIQDEIERCLDLNKLSIYLGLENVVYEPEEFPGLTFKNEISFNIYSSGKILAFGKDIENIKKELSNLKSELRSF